MKDEFINCWLLAKDLSRIAKQSGDPDIEKLCRLIKDNYKYPVDSVLISHDLSVFGHVNVNKNIEILMPDGYLKFLSDGLGNIGKTTEVAENRQAEDSKKIADTAKTKPKRPVGVKLTRADPEASLLEVARSNGLNPGMTFYPVDIRDFADGGTIEIEARLGGGETTVQCELCAPHPQNPQFSVPVESISSLKPGETKTISYKFKENQNLIFVVKGMPGEEEQLESAILATFKMK